MFYIPGSNWAWYPIEGEPDGEDYRFFGLVFDPDFEWRDFTLFELLTIAQSVKGGVERDLGFREGPFTDVVPAPE